MATAALTRQTTTTVRAPDEIVSGGGTVRIGALAPVALKGGAVVVGGFFATEALTAALARVEMVRNFANTPGKAAAVKLGAGVMLSLAASALVYKSAASQGAGRGSAAAAALKMGMLVLIGAIFSVGADKLRELAATLVGKVNNALGSIGTTPPVRQLPVSGSQAQAQARVLKMNRAGGKLFYGDTGDAFGGFANTESGFRAGGDAGFKGSTDPTVAPNSIPRTEAGFRY